MLVFNWLLGRDQVKQELWPRRLAFFRRRTSRCLQNVIRQRVPFKCMGFWYIRSRISAAAKKRESLGLFTPKTRVFSATEILLRLYQNPIHLNGARWQTTFFRRRTSRCLQNLVRQRFPFKCMGFWYIRSRISVAEKTRVFGVNRPYSHQRRAFFRLRKFCCGYIKTPYI